jgi:hypothetical protein
MERLQTSAMFFPAMVTARISGLSLVPPQAPHGMSRM